MSWWPHAPVHMLGEAGAYILTAGTYRRRHHFRGDERSQALHDLMLETASKHELRLQAWAVFSNHYHLIAISDSGDLAPFVQEFHSRAAHLANHWDGATGRTVFHQYWDTHLTFQRSYLARLSYVMQNPVKHGLVRLAWDYPYCSASWFRETAPRPFLEVVKQMKVDKLFVPDEYDPVLE